jgi:hypothetical protein
MDIMKPRNTTTIRVNLIPWYIICRRQDLVTIYSLVSAKIAPCFLYFGLLLLKRRIKKERRLIICLPLMKQIHPRLGLSSTRGGRIRKNSESHAPFLWGSPSRKRVRVGDLPTILCPVTMQKRFGYSAIGRAGKGHPPVLTVFFGSGKSYETMLWIGAIL